MTSDPSNEESGIPAAYTYFGQFIDHDITKTRFDESMHPPGGPDPIEAGDLTPIPRANVFKLISNDRSAVLDLDSVYTGMAAEAIEPDGTFRLSEVSPSNAPELPKIATADSSHDLPRRPLIANPQSEDEQERDRQALIGDPRNDENLLVAQLHLAFLRSHNVLVRDRKMSFDEARTAIRRRYQWAVLHDFLPRVCERAVIEDVLRNGPRFWQVDRKEDLVIPLEFSVAAYRFGHSMIRGEYSHNATFTRPPEGKVPATFNFFFTFTALSGDLQPGPGASEQFPTLPDNWPIEWHRFFGTAGNQASPNPARRIDPNLTPELAKLRDFQGNPIETLMARLATRNLRRSFLLGLPTGQAVAARLGIKPLSPDTLRAATPTGLDQTIGEAGLLERTPLWFYILAEAGDPAGPNGQHLGAVGSRIVAETFYNLAKHATDSVIATRPTEAELETGEFTLKGIVKIGQDQGMPPIT
ncbi:peroxidase family protein [Methylorubrum extorquens]